MCSAAPMPQKIMPMRCRSRLDLVKSIKDLQQQLDKANEGADKREAQVQQVENDLNAIATELQRLTPKQQYLRFTTWLLLTEHFTTMLPSDWEL